MKERQLDSSLASHIVGAITEYRFQTHAGRDGNLALVCYNVTAPLTAQATPVTAEADKMVAARG